MATAGLDCPHENAPAAGCACEHLVAEPALPHARRFTGVGRVYELVCLACAGAPEEELEDRLGFVCADCFAAIHRDGVWSPEEGILGAPEEKERPEDLAFSHEMVRLAQPLGAIEDVAPLAGDAAPAFLVLLAGGRLVRLDLGARSAEPILSLDRLGSGCELVVADSGGLAAVVEARGRRGAVIDLARGRVAMELDRGAAPAGEHQADFPVAFVDHGGRTLVVHAASSFRLDLSDPDTGALLSARELEGRAGGYHHGRLLAAPGSEWIADSGFVDGPAGFVSVFSARRWLEDNRFEPEDGPSLKYFDQRWHFWDGPLCWIDGRTLAVWGYGPAGGLLLDAVLLYDAEAGEFLDWFPGPRGRLAFDEYLFSMSDDLGTAVWDVATGELIHRDPGFHPQRYHAGARSFLTAHPEGEFFVVSRLLRRS